MDCFVVIHRIIYSYSTDSAPDNVCTADRHCNSTMSQSITTSAPDTGGPAVERACDTLIMCIVTTLNKGLRSGGGIGDVLRKSSVRVRSFFTHVYSKWPLTLLSQAEFRRDRIRLEPAQK